MGKTNIKIENNERALLYKTHSDNVMRSSQGIVFEKTYDPENENEIDLPKSALIEYEYDSNGNETGVKWQIQNPTGLPSFANPYFNIRLVTHGDKKYPMLDSEARDMSIFHDELTAMDLINNPRGASIYAPEDFLYLKNYEILKLNKLLTLRRFAHPCVDDIFSIQEDSTPDIARVLGYFDNETNRLSEFLSFSFGLGWKPLSSRSEKAEMQGPGDQSGISGIAGKVMRFVDPKYGQEAMRGPIMNVDPQQDQNRVYGPVDSIAETHIRDIGVKFAQDMTLKFQYEMKSYDGINQKAAFIDMLSNIILLVTNDAKFWGGARYWVGPRPSKYMSMLKKYDATNWQDWVSKASQGLKDTFGSLSKPGNARAMLQNIFNNAMNLALGKLLNLLGRTGVPVMNSLLSGNPVGPWHLTVGNPLNPIMVAGDLILDDATVSFGDELGFDDFPTEIELTVNIKHAKPKGRAEIENMFNVGRGRLYMKPKEIKKLKSSISNPTTVSNSEFTGSRFGSFNHSDIEKNHREVWSFLSDK